MKWFANRLTLRDCATASILLSLLVLLFGGCSQPLLVGAQIEDPPPGFMFDANSSGGRPVFQDRNTLDQRSYFYMAGDDHCSITINVLSGPTTLDQARAALQHHLTTYPNKEYGSLETITIDGREGWGWEARQMSRSGELLVMEYHSIVSYPETDRTYTVEFHAGIERFMDEDLLKKTIQSFTVKQEKEVSYGQIGLVALLVIGFAAGYRRLRS